MGLVNRSFTGPVRQSPVAFPAAAPPLVSVGGYFSCPRIALFGNWGVCTFT